MKLCRTAPGAQGTVSSVTIQSYSSNASSQQEKLWLSRTVQSGARNCQLSNNSIIFLQRQ